VAELAPEVRQLALRMEGDEREVATEFGPRVALDLAPCRVTDERMGLVDGCKRARAAAEPGPPLVTSRRMALGEESEQARAAAEPGPPLVEAHGAAPVTAGLDLRAEARARRATL
jgi:hypothetical protein